MPFEISEVVNHGLKTNSSMVIAFKETPSWELRHWRHCYSLLDKKDNLVKIYNLNGRYLLIPESVFYQNLEELNISYSNNKIFRMPEI